MGVATPAWRYLAVPACASNARMICTCRGRVPQRKGLIAHENDDGSINRMPATQQSGLRRPRVAQPTAKRRVISSACAGSAARVLDDMRKLEEDLRREQAQRRFQRIRYGYR